jgi:hypothetical protein
VQKPVQEPEQELLLRMVVPSCGSVCVWLMRLVLAWTGDLRRIKKKEEKMRKKVAVRFR